MTRLGASLIIVLAMTPGFALMAQGQTAPFVVGVWGQGDAIIPFADFDGQRWRSNWPSPVEAQPDSIPLSQIPAEWWGRSTFRSTWELIEPNDGRRSVQITGTAPAGLGSDCSGSLGLKTDAPVETFPYGTVLAASRSGVVEPVNKLASNAAGWRTVSALLPEIYRRHEAKAWKDVSEDFRPDMDAALSTSRLDALYMFRDELGEYAYFESSRQFARRREQAGDQRSVITGWLWRPSATTPFQLVTVQATTSDGDGKGAASLRPLGVVRDGSRRFWLATLSSYAYSGVTVLGVSRAGVRQLLLVDYPGC
jgi:hypothetical protein